MKLPATYIVANKKRGTIYTGVTSNLVKRIFEHRSGLVKGFTQKYGCKDLVYFEQHATMSNAILREKSIKALSRENKIALIENKNAEWRDLYDDIKGV